MDENINPWIVKSQKNIYDNPWINLTEFQVINPSGGNGIYGKVHFKNLAIGVVALDDEMNTYLVGQYRFVLDSYSWEIPEGGCPEGSDPLASAKRELHEETGLVAHNWKLLFRLSLSNSVTDEYAFIFLAQKLEQHQAMPEETEQLQVRRLPFEEAWKMVESGQIHDAITVAAFQKIRLMQLANQLP